MSDPKKAVIPGNQKTCPRESGDEYFLIFTRNPLRLQNPLESGMLYVVSCGL
jgi:hypothetical protein